MWGISWVPWGIQYHGDIISTMGIILSTVGDVQYCGGYHDACGGNHEYYGGCSVPWRENLLLFEYPMVLNTPIVLMISPTCIMISPYGTQISKDSIPHGTEHPHGTHDIPTCIMISSTVLNIPHSTQDNPPWYSWYPHGIEHPHSTQGIPHGSHDIPPWYWTPPWYWAPPQYCTHIIQGDPSSIKRVMVFWTRISIFMNFGQFRVFGGIKFVNKLLINLLFCSHFQLKSKRKGRNNEFYREISSEMSEEYSTTKNKLNTSFDNGFYFKYKG